MVAKNEAASVGLDRVNGVFAWWGLSGADSAGKLDGQFKRFHAFTSDLQRAFGDTYGAQMSTLLGANERIGRSFQEFLKCRQPQDVIAAEASVLAAILEETSLQTKTWLELSRKVQECCAAMVRETADEVRQKANEGTDAKRGVNAS